MKPTARASARTARSSSVCAPERAREEPTHAVIVGNVTQDRAGTTWKPGGPSLFSALSARALGCDVTLVTHLPSDYDDTVLGGMTVVSAPSPTAARYENRYDARGNRSQVLLAPGTVIGAGLLDRLQASRPDLLLLAPAYHEVRGWPSLQAGIRAVALQGPFRTTDTGGAVRATARPWLAARPFAQPGVFIFFSEEDCPGGDALARRATAAGATVTITRGRRGVSVFQGTSRRDLPAYPADERDPTGAGDCFATAFLVRLVETGSLEQALSYGLAAGALAVQAEGIAGVPRREAVEALVRRMAA